MSKKRRTTVIIYTLVFFLILFIWHIYIGKTVRYIPQYKKENISSLIRKKELASEDFVTIYEQTGVSPYIAKKLLKNENYETLQILNQLYFQKQEIEKSFIAYPITLKERNKEEIIPIADLKRGDILITFSTHTFGWRHGHCAMVLDEDKKVLLEHMSLGEVSCKTSINNWESCPTLLVLRHKNEKVAKKAAEYAQKNLMDIPYNFLAGVIKKDKSDEKPPSSSHCSHIIWQAYKSAGVDLDSNKGIFVTPKDISMSENLEVIQIFGINPEKYTNRIKK